MSRATPGRPSIARSAIVLASRAYRRGDHRGAEGLIGVYRGARAAGAAKPEIGRDPDEVAEVLARRIDRVKRAVPEELRAL